MADEKTDNREKILDAFCKGALVMREEEPSAAEGEKAVEEEKAAELTDEQRAARMRSATEHLFGGGAFVEREF